ncbi:MAG TPA: hypothetical protein VFU03_04465 [Gemmatimonadales bacterium]|nr:hypothetical protein [Gemmatimonadales bacterium]
MTSCEEMLERMPGVALGEAQWTEEEATHLAGCSSCQAEWSLIQKAVAVGSQGPALDLEKTGAAVLGRLRAERRERRLRRVGLLTGLAAAAAVALVVWSRVPHRAEQTVPEAFRIPVAELDSLDNGELQSVLQDLDAPLGAGTLSNTPGLGDLDDVQLERLLRSLEG